MKEHYLQLFKYDDWASGKLLSVLVENRIDNEAILQKFSHILFARQIWLWQILGKTELPKQLENASLENLIAAIDADKAEWINYLESADDEDFSYTIEYRRTQGTPFETEIKDILTHVVNHSTYHRGQIAAILKLIYDKVPSTDFIFYLREI